MKIGAMVIKNGTGDQTSTYLIAGKSVKCHLNGKDKSYSVKGVTISITDKKSGSALTRCKTDANGQFSMTIPQNFSGELRLTIVGDPKDPYTCPGCYVFPILPPYPYHLTPLEVGEVELGDLDLLKKYGPITVVKPSSISK